MNECVHYWLFSAALSCGGKKTLLLPLCMKRRITICRDEIGNSGSSTGTAARSTPSYIKENLSRNLWSGTAADRKHLHLVFFLVKTKHFGDV